MWAVRERMKSDLAVTSTNLLGVHLLKKTRLLLSILAHAQTHGNIANIPDSEYITTGCPKKARKILSWFCYTSAVL